MKFLHPPSSSSSRKHIAFVSLHYQYLPRVYIYIRVYTILELARRWRRPVTREGCGSRRSYGRVEDCNRPRCTSCVPPVWPPVVCSFCAAIPYLEVQCLLSLIHTPWPTRAPPLVLTMPLSTRPSSPFTLFLPNVYGI